MDTEELRDYLKENSNKVNTIKGRILYASIRQN